MRRVLLLTSVFIGLIIFGFVSTAMAAPSLLWHTDNLYYDSQGRMVIEGYFLNIGSRTITWVNWHNVQVYFRQQKTDWWLQAETTYKDLNVYLNPGDSIRWNFKITDVGYSDFDYYDVRWNVNYQYD